MGRLQYISTSNGSFNSVLEANLTSSSVVEQRFLSTAYVPSTICFGVDYADIKLCNTWTYNREVYWYDGGKYVASNEWTLNEWHTVSLSTTAYYWNGVKVYEPRTASCNIPSSPVFKPSLSGKLDYFKITTSGVVTVNLVAWEENGVVGLKDLVSGVFYQPSSGTWTAGPPVQDDTNIVPVKKYKLGANNITKTYEGGTKINKMYVGNDLVYRALPSTTTPTTPTNVDYVHTSSSTSTDNYIDTGVYPTVNTTFRIVYKPNANIDSTLVGFDGGSTPIQCLSDSTDYRYFYHRSLNEVTFDFNSSRFYKTIAFDADGYADITVGNNYITDNISQSTATGTTQSSITPNIPIYLNVSNGVDFQSLEIWENNTKVYDGHAAVLNGDYGVYDSVGGTFTTQTYGGNTMTGGNL